MRCMDDVEVLPGVRLTKYFALWLERERTVVIADLHLGFEGALFEEGFALPRFQKRAMLQRLGKLLRKYSPGKLIIAGDLKHEFSRNLAQEWAEVNDVLDFLEGRVELAVIRGNHDNYLRTILARRSLELPKVVRGRRRTFAHGHEEVDWKGLLVMGHEHPSARLRDEIGASIKVPCFLVGKDVVVLPAFSPLAYGTDVTAMAPISPPLRGLDFGDLRVFTVDEKVGLLDFGPVKGLL